MRYLPILINFCWIFSASGQDAETSPNPLSLLKLRPSIQASYQPHNGISMHRFNVEFGVQDKNRLFLFFGTGYETTKQVNYENAKFDYFTNSISIDLRILKAKYLFSPMLHLDLGWAYKSDSVPISGYYHPTIYSDLEHDYIGYFDQVRQFGSFQLKFDFLFTPIHIQVGGGIYFNKLTYYAAYDDLALNENRQKGLIGSVAVVYDFDSWRWSTLKSKKKGV